MFDRLRRQMGIHRAVSLYTSAQVYVPTVIGWVKPVVLLPVMAMSGLSTEQIESILAHELAHIQRQDYLVNMVQTLVEILGFYHPAVWWVSQQIRIEREHCCDDLAVGVCGNSVAYARALTHLETSRSGSGVLAMAATGGSLTYRIKRLIQAPSTCQSAPTWVCALLLALVLLAIACPVAVAWAQSFSVNATDGDEAGLKERSKDASESTAVAMPSLLTRIYDVSDLLTGKAGAKKPSLEANVLAQTIKLDIEPESWHPAEGHGTCIVFSGSKLAVLQTKEIHAKIELYLAAMRSSPSGAEQPISSVEAPLRLTTRIYDVSDLVTGQAGPEEQALTVNVLVQMIKTNIKPQSWYPAGGDGTCTVYKGIKLAVLQTKPIHARISLYLAAMRSSSSAQEKPIPNLETRPKLGARIYDISDLVSGPAESKEQSLEANFLAHRIKAEVAPQSWMQTEGTGTCKAYEGTKLAVFQTQEIHAKINLYLTAWRQFGSSSDGSILPAGWGLEYRDWDQKVPGTEVRSSLGVKMLTAQARPNERCQVRITTFSGGFVTSVGNEDVDEKRLSLENTKYLVFYEGAWGKHPDNVSVRTGPFLLDLSRPGQYRFTPTSRFGSGEIRGTHKGCYAVNFQSTDRFPVMSGYACQSPAGEYKFDGLASGHYLLNAVTQHDGDSVFVRRARVSLVQGKSVHMALPQLAAGRCALKGSIMGKPSIVQNGEDRGSDYSWAILIRQANARPISTCDVYESLTMDTDYVIRGKNIVQETESRTRYTATGLLPGTYTVTAIELCSLAGFEVQRQQSKPITIRDGESVTLDFAL